MLVSWHKKQKNTARTIKPLIPHGEVRTVDAEGNTLTSHQVEAGDIWRAC